MKQLLKTSLVALFFITIGYASNDLSENYFIQGHAYSLTGQDSLACYFYGLACQNDTTSITLKEIYSQTLLKNGNKNDALPILRVIAKSYEMDKNWTGLFQAYKDIYRITQNYKDEGMLALAIFCDGIDKKDSLRINGAHKIWKYLLDQALLNNDLDKALEIIDIQIQAHHNAISILKMVSEKPKRYHQPLFNRYIQS